MVTRSVTPREIERLEQASPGPGLSMRQAETLARGGAISRTKLARFKGEIDFKKAGRRIGALGRAGSITRSQEKILTSLLGTKKRQRAIKIAERKRQAAIKKAEEERKQKLKKKIQKKIREYNIIGYEAYAQTRAAKTAGVPGAVNLDDRLQDKLRRLRKDLSKLAREEGIELDPSKYKLTSKEKEEIEDETEYSPGFISIGGRVRPAYPQEIQEAVGLEFERRKEFIEETISAEEFIKEAKTPQERVRRTAQLSARLSQTPASAGRLAVEDVRIERAERIPKLDFSKIEEPERGTEGQRLLSKRVFGEPQLQKGKSFRQQIRDLGFEEFKEKKSLFEEAKGKAYGFLVAPALFTEKLLPKEYRTFTKRYKAKKVLEKEQKEYEALIKGKPKKKTEEGYVTVITEKEAPEIEKEFKEYEEAYKEYESALATPSIFEKINEDIKKTKIDLSKAGETDKVRFDLLKKDIINLPKERGESLTYEKTFGLAGQQYIDIGYELSEAGEKVSDISTDIRLGKVFLEPGKEYVSGQLKAGGYISRIGGRLLKEEIGQKPVKYAATFSISAGVGAVTSKAAFKPVISPISKYALRAISVGLGTSYAIGKGVQYYTAPTAAEKESVVASTVGELGATYIGFKFGMGLTKEGKAIEFFKKLRKERPTDIKGRTYLTRKKSLFTRKSDILGGAKKIEAGKITDIYDIYRPESYIYTARGQGYRAFTGKTGRQYFTLTRKIGGQKYFLRGTVSPTGKLQSKLFMGDKPLVSISKQITPDLSFTEPTTGIKVKEFISKKAEFAYLKEFTRTTKSSYAVSKVKPKIFKPTYKPSGESLLAKYKFLEAKTIDPRKITILQKPFSYSIKTGKISPKDTFILFQKTKYKFIDYPTKARDVLIQSDSKFVNILQPPQTKVTQMYDVGGGFSLKYQQQPSKVGKTFLNLFSTKKGQFIFTPDTKISPEPITKFIQRPSSVGFDFPFKLDVYNPAVQSYQSKLISPLIIPDLKKGLRPKLKPFEVTKFKFGEKELPSEQQEIIPEFEIVQKKELQPRRKKKLTTQTEVTTELTKIVPEPLIPVPTIQPPIKPPKPPTFGPPKPGMILKFPELEEKEITKKPKGKRKLKYQPSLGAIEYDIKSPKVDIKMKKLTGLEVRPIPININI